MKLLIPVSQIDADLHIFQESVSVPSLGIRAVPYHRDDSLDDIVADAGVFEGNDIIGGRKLNRPHVFAVYDRSGIFEKRAFLNNHLDGFLAEPRLFHVNNFLYTEGRGFNDLFPDHQLNRSVTDTGLFQTHDILAFQAESRCGNDKPKQDKTTEYDACFFHSLLEKLDQTRLNDSSRSGQCGLIGQLNILQFHNRFGNVRFFFPGH